jgi:hypothetical protein
MQTLSAPLRESVILLWFCRDEELGTEAQSRQASSIAVYPTYLCRGRDFPSGVLTNLIVVPPVDVQLCHSTLQVASLARVLLAQRAASLDSSEAPFPEMQKALVVSQVQQGYQ